MVKNMLEKTKCIFAQRFVIYIQHFRTINQLSFDGRNIKLFCCEVYFILLNSEFIYFSIFRPIIYGKNMLEKTKFIFAQRFVIYIQHFRTINQLSFDCRNIKLFCCEVYFILLNSEFIYF
jgi:hypothetical protein